jgi:hypothetical protein
MRRRRKTRQMEHDTAVSATLAAAGFGRSPLHDDDFSDEPSSGRRSSAFMAQTGAGSASIFGSRAPSTTFAAYADPFATPHNHLAGASHEGGYDMHGPGPVNNGYSPAPGGQGPLPVGAMAPDRAIHHQHTSSYEPLLGAAGLAAGPRTPATLSPPGSPPGSPLAQNREGYFAAEMARGPNSPGPAVPPRSPMRPAPATITTFSRASSVYSQDDVPDTNTVHEPEKGGPRLEVRNGVSRASSVVDNRG